MTLRKVSLCAFTLTSMLTFKRCQTAPVPEQKRDVAADLKAINALLDQNVAAWNANDAAAVAATYADDAITMIPDQAATEGKQAIQIWLEAYFKKNPSKATLTILETQVAGD